MFKKNFVRLCNEKGIPPTTACVELGLTKSAFSNWTDSTVPRAATLEKMADYFGVSTESLLNWPEEQKKNDIQADIILKMRANEKFYSTVVKLSKLDDAKLDALSQMLDTFLE